MKLIDAIKLSRKVPDNARHILMISSMETDLLETFLTAETVLSDQPKKIRGSEFGDIFVTLRALSKKDDLPDAIILVLDWDDLVPGASLRSGAPSPDIYSDYPSRSKELGNIIHDISKSHGCLVVVVPPIAPSLLHLMDTEESYGLGHKYITSAWIIFLETIYQGSNSNRIQILRNLKNTFKEVDCSLLFRSGWPLNVAATQELALQIRHSICKKHEFRKLIIADLDDTLWLGTLGEVGYENISWDFTENGFKHLLFQRVLLALNKHGILLAVCSKNEHEIALDGLKRNDIVVPLDSWVTMRVSWQPKSQMIREILEELNLTEQAFLFIDNSDYELEEVRRHFPEAGFLKFPEQNIDIPNFLTNLFSEFPMQIRTGDDQLRAQSYSARAQFNTESKSASDLSEYLQGMKMEARIQYVASADETRPLQLLNKTNQFNLNGIRETLESWQGYFKENGYHVFQVELKDRLADHGVIAVIVSQKVGEVLEVHHWVMSCRVFSRGLEDGIAKWLSGFAHKLSCNELMFKVLETTKNKVLRSWIKGNTKLVSNYQFLADNKTIPFRYIAPSKKKFLGTIKEI